MLGSSDVGKSLLTSQFMSSNDVTVYNNDEQIGKLNFFSNQSSFFYGAIFFVKQDSKRAVVKSWGCHTGESMSKKWKRATGVPMIGAVGKTDYSVMYRNNWLPALSKGRWTR